MLQSLSDLFLVISSDTSKITNQDLSIFYTFIIKKIPQIEQKFPLIISKTLSMSSNESKENQIDIDEYKINKDYATKKLFIHFQKQIFNLFADLIYFCFKEGIIKLNNRILKENILTKVGFNGSKQPNDNEVQKFLIYLFINNKVNCTLYPNEYIKFFNSENNNKRRIIAERFMKFIKQMIIIYKENKKHYNLKRVSNTEKKMSNIEKKFGLNRPIDEKNVLSLTKFADDENSNKNNTSLSDKSIIMNNSAENSIEEDEANDTLCCNTPKNISIKDYSNEINYNNNLNKIGNKLTIINNQNKNKLENLSQRNTYNIRNQKNNFNIINDNLGDKNTTNYKNFFNDKNTHKNSYINKSQNFIFNNNFHSNNNYNNNEVDFAGCNIN